MKRTNKASLALATAGALVLGVAPAAMAQNATSIDELTGGDPSATAGATVVTSNLPETKPDPALGGVGEATSEPTSANSMGNAHAQKPMTAPARNVLCKNEDGSETMWYRHRTGDAYVKNKADVDAVLPIEGEMTSDYMDQQVKNGENTGCVYYGQGEDVAMPHEVTVDPKDAAKAAAVIAGLGVGTAVIVNGIKYFVNKDKATLVPSEDRVNQEPTAEEKAKSDELKQNNADQIASQGGTDTDANAAGNAGANAAGNAADTNRGIGATTGNNSIAKGLISLALLSVLGAAVFAFGRRRLV